MMYCTLCTELCQSRTQIVDRVRIGQPEAPNVVLLVGEAPGEVEDKLGEPWVGKAGRKLKGLLSDLGITDYYASNSIRCRPPKNRTPKKDEIRNCATFLLNDILEVQPNLIVCAGEVAWKAVNTVVLEAGLDIRIVKALHPSAVFHRPGLQERLEREWKEAFAERPANLRRLQYRVGTMSFGEVSAGIGRGETIAMDVETDGEDEGKPISFQWARRMPDGSIEAGLILQ